MYEGILTVSSYIACISGAQLSWIDQRARECNLTLPCLDMC